MKDMVTELREIHGGYRVTVNSSENFRLSPAEYRDFPLKDGEELDWEAYRNALLLRQYPEALNRTVAFLAARAHSRHEVEQKLALKGYLSDTVEMVVYKLEKEGLLDDAAFATAWVEGRASRGLGKARLLQELRMKGVEDGIAKAAVAELDVETQDTQALILAAKVLKRYGNLDSREAMQKAVGAMLRRGYNYGEASHALQSAIAQASEEE